MGKKRLLDRVRDSIRSRHYSLRTEQSYIQWIRRFILFHGKRHPLLISTTGRYMFVPARGTGTGLRYCPTTLDRHYDHSLSASSHSTKETSKRVTVKSNCRSRWIASIPMLDGNGSGNMSSPQQGVPLTPSRV